MFCFVYFVLLLFYDFFFFFQAEDGIRDYKVTEFRRVLFRSMVGMLTFKEVLMALDERRGALDDARVRDTMEHDPVTASPAMEVNDLRRIMIESGARYLPVMDRDKLLGVISFRDVAKAVLEEQDFENRMLKGYIKNWPE